MARFPKTLGDLLASQSESGRDLRTTALETPDLVVISTEHLDTALKANIETLNTDLATISTDIASVDDRIAQAVDASMAIPLSDERFSDSSLTIWPFIEGAVPKGALAPGAVGSSDIADFSLVVRKFNDDRHRLY